MSRNHWYGEEPFPWLLLVLPFLYLYATLKEVFRNRGVSGGEPIYIGTEPPVHTIEYGPPMQMSDLSVGPRYPTDAEWDRIIESWKGNG